MRTRFPYAWYRVLFTVYNIPVYRVPCIRYADKVSVISLNFWGILSQSCFFRPDYLKQLVFTTVLPLSIVAALVVSYARTIK